jgi:hypothetical protein
VRWKQFILSVTAIIVLRFTDLYITYLYTPDLASEWNPLIRLLGATWNGFIFTQFILLAFVIFLMVFYFNRRPVVIDIKDLLLHDFVYVYFFGKLRSWPQRLFSGVVPMHLKRHLIFNGFIFMSIAIIISIFAIIHNILLITNVTGYIAFVRNHYSIYFPACFMCAVIFSVYLFFLIEFRRYRKTLMKSEM